ncbi:hypothetical protein [Campylobacter troglodytis]|uniref:hypothetical protein n=1 Tax=Campylobacter troglodytis TaxID=654363 RepID=UPI00115B9A2F|nr:hypothetical protein [Campylobacter troglodytis]TQR61168.1 hypothetical protein DMC01_02540 [Campylobacter troglodytis]
MAKFFAIKLKFDKIFVINFKGKSINFLITLMQDYPKFTDSYSTRKVFANLVFALANPPKLCHKQECKKYKRYKG